MQDPISSANAQFTSIYPDFAGSEQCMAPENVSYRQDYLATVDQCIDSSATPGATAGPATMPCVHPPEPPPDPNADKCKAASLTVVKEGGDYVLKIPGTEETYHDKQYKDLTVLEIVCGPKKKSSAVKIQAAGVVGPCAQKHKNKAFIYIKDDIDLISRNDTELKFKAYYRDFKTTNTFSAFIDLVKYLFDRKPVSYRVGYSLCGFNHSSNVKVYPKLAAAASIGLNYEWKFTKKGEGLEKESGPDAGIRNKLNYSFSIKYDSDSIVSVDSQNSKADEPGENKKNALEQLRDSFDENSRYLSKGLSVFLGEGQTLEITVSPSLSCSVSLEEVPGLPFVDTKYQVELGFNPLVKMLAKADISGKLLLGVPVIGPFLSAAVSAAEGVGLADVFLGFVVDGQVAVTGNLTKYPGKKFEGPKLKVEGKVTIDMKARVESKYKVWRIKWSVGAEAGAQSGVKVEETRLAESSKGVYFPLKVVFLGIMVYWQSWASAGISEERTDVPNKVKKSRSANVLGQDGVDVADLPESNKAMLVDPSTLYQGDVYLMGG